MASRKKMLHDGICPYPERRVETGKGSADGRSRLQTAQIDEDGNIINIPQLGDNEQQLNPYDVNSYRVINNLKVGEEVEANKNTKVTLELLQKMDFEDIDGDDSDNFRPSDVLLPEDQNSNSEEEESVFNYLFPDGLKKKHDKDNSRAIVGKNQFSEKVYNLKKKGKKGRKRKGPVKGAGPMNGGKKQPMQPSQVEEDIPLSKEEKTVPLKRNASLKSLNMSSRGSKKPLPSLKGSVTHRRNKAPSEKSKSRDRSKSSKRSMKGSQKGSMISRADKIENIRAKEEKDMMQRGLNVANQSVNRGMKTNRGSSKKNL